MTSSQDSYRQRWFFNLPRRSDFDFSESIAWMAKTYVVAPLALRPPLVLQSKALPGIQS
ncbi:hypothetical protein [Nodularia sp. UHCC 0506]|uniref:hypothetical protein n=1 Tax=Nodularia sp. UHCC 0506 TaxID=3110243 RepID=UPI002B2007D1|nr:hypothetical protein [Nodularia sp. UHCC 0506]MEA5513860.1 hypothetical protein [Nodularia sp. UHCC 0506]